MLINTFANKSYWLKKFYTISILALMAFSQIGYYIVAHQMQEQRKEYIRKLLYQSIDENTLTVIDYTSNNKKIFWEEEGKEFFFNRKMYDLVKTKLINGKTYFYCINDEKEKELIDNYNLVTKNNSGTDKKAKNTFENVISPYILISAANSQRLIGSVVNYLFPASNIEFGFASIAFKPPSTS